jgi:ABC-2 type transport system permease protein
LSGIRLYLRYLAVSVKAQLQYKLSFALFSLGHAAVTGIEFLGLWALFSRFGGIRGWTLAEVAVFYGLANMIFACADALARGFDVFAQMVKSGEFDTILIRPRSTVLQIIGREVTLRRVGRLLQGLIVFIYGAGQLGISFDLKNLFLIGLMFVNGIFFFMAVIILQATASFWAVESLEVFNTLSYGGVYSAQYPLNIYKEYFQKFFLFIAPLGAVTYIPICTLLGKQAFPGLPPAAGFFTPFAGLAFLIVSWLFWRLGVRHYRSTGT